MNSWLNSLSSRERALVTYGSIAVAIVLLWLLAVKPLYDNKTNLNKTISLQKEILVTMRKQSIEIGQLQKNKTDNPKTANTQNPQQLIERSLQTWRLKPVLERMQTQGSGVRVILKKANADRVMRFLHELESKYDLSINDLTIDNNKEAGFADFHVTIQRETK